MVITQERNYPNGVISNTATQSLRSDDSACAENTEAGQAQQYSKQDKIQRMPCAHVDCRQLAIADESTGKELQCTIDCVNERLLPATSLQYFQLIDLNIPSKGSAEATSAYSECIRGLTGGDDRTPSNCYFLSFTDSHCPLSDPFYGISSVEWITRRAIRES